ncbi:MAG TPA: alpha/beta hydrolase-fold protein [Mycobacteriales bacterium]|nr:alpha/beta hydrolase-fold protein [Mycobacteriales bacterium]
MRLGRAAALALATAVAASALAAAPATAGTAFARTASDARPQPRLVTITIPAPHGEIAAKWLPYSGPPRANVLLPAGYDPAKRYPLIVVLNGLNTDYSWWHDWKLDVPLEALHAIVVMPEGASGWYTDWWNDGKRGDPSWESYELDTVLPTILERYLILPQRRYHALLGVSMGGMGSAYLGGRLPGFFGSVGILSGFVDPQYFAPIADAFMEATSLAPLKGDEDLLSVEGRPYGFYMRGHNPTQLVMNLRQTRVFESTGNGAPSPVAAYNTPGSEEEGVAIYPMSQRFHRAAVAAGVDISYHEHTGGHDIPDFLREVEAYVRWDPFEPVITRPTSWTNETVATHGQLWDIGYRFAKPPTRVVQFSRTLNRLSISDAGSDVTLTTSGGCTIHTGTPATVWVPRHC